MARGVASEVGHKAGRIIEVDWSGPTMAVVDPDTGETRKVYLFVACLPFSRYSYVEPTLDMKQDTWLRCHVHAFEFIGGSVPCIVPNNLKTGVRSHPRESEIVLNDSYREMATHYGSAVIPARVGRPRDKASAEGTVGNVTTAVIATLRNRTFTDIGQLLWAVHAALDTCNAAPFQKREGSRRLVFEEERPLLRPLPAVPYEICEWVQGRKVQASSHVCYKRNYYSVSCAYVGATVDLRVTATVLEVYLGGERLATHALLPGRAANRYSTHDADMPKGELVLRLGRREDPQVGGEGRALVPRGREPHIRRRRPRRAGLQRLPRRPEALEAIRRRAARGRMRDRAVERRAFAALQAPEPDTEDRAGQRAPRRGAERPRGRRMGPRRGLLRGGVSMVIDSETKRKLRDMGAGDLLAALEAQDDDACAGLSFAERLQAAVDEAHSQFVTSKVSNLTRRANLRYPDADVRRLALAEERGLDRVKIAELSTCGFAERGANVVIEGFTGSGKSFLSCALAREACKRRMRSYYVRVPDLEEQWREACDRPSGVAKLLKKMGNFTVLVLDEWLLDVPDDGFRSFLLELMERRYGAASTIFCTQFKRKDWHARLGGGVHADAIMDRIVHNAVWVETGEVNMRAKLEGLN